MTTRTQTQPKIFVAGHRGMVGSAIVRTLHQLVQPNIVTRPHTQLAQTASQVVAYQNFMQPIGH